MSASRKKWIGMGVSVVLIGGVSLFLVKVTQRSQGPAV